MTCHDIVATGRYPYTGRLGILTQEDECLVEEAMQAVHAQELGNRDLMRSVTDRSSAFCWREQSVRIRM